jgi:hypothetical protein
MDLKSLFESDKLKGLIAVIAAIVIYYTPSNVDLVIESLLAMFGIQKLILKEENK